MQVTGDNFDIRVSQHVERHGSLYPQLVGTGAGTKIVMDQIQYLLGILLFDACFQVGQLRDNDLFRRVGLAATVDQQNEYCGDECAGGL